MSKLTDVFGLCRRAGGLITGFDPVCESISAGKAKIVILAADISEKTKKEILFALKGKNIPLYRADETLDEINFAIGRRTGVICIEDENLAKLASPLCALV